MFKKPFACLLSLLIAAPLSASSFKELPAGAPAPQEVVRPQASLPQLPTPLVVPSIKQLPEGIPQAETNPVLGILAPVQAGMEALAPEKLAHASDESAGTSAGAIFSEGEAKPGAAAEPLVPEVQNGAQLAPSSPASEPAKQELAAPAGPSIDRPFFIRHYKLARWLVVPLVRLFYKVDATGIQNLPPGPAIVVPNHISYVDGIILSYAAGRPMRFMLKRSIYEKPLLKPLFKAIGAIPIASGDQKSRTQESLERARAALKDGQSVIIFPEGMLTRNGQMNAFKRGFEKLADGLNVPVVPVHLDGLWGSVFSLEGSSLWSKLKQMPRRVAVRIGAPLLRADSQEAREAVQQLGAENLAQRTSEGETLPLAFLRQAKAHFGERAAADSLGQDLTYGKTLTGAVALSQLLKKEASGGKNVGVLMPPSAGGVLANLALSINGQVPVNLNYTASREALDHALSTAQIQDVITSRKFVEALKAKGSTLPVGRYVYLEDLLPQVSNTRKTLLFLALKILPRWAVEKLFFKDASKNMDDVATVLFTSGSSALPKGVALTHANISSNVEMVREVFPFGRKDVVLGVLPFFHSFGLTITLWFPLLTGMAAAYHTHPLETEAIAKLAKKFQPTMLLGTPTFLQRYVQKIEAEAFTKLRLVIAGAEKLRGAIADDFQKKFGARPLEGYGATELSPVATVNLPDVDHQKGEKPGSVGQNLPGTAVRVVDPDTWQPLPYGKQGMLLVKGPHVMKEYLGEPAKTSEVIKEGWYVTGDLAAIDRDGFITLGGRMTRFSKIAGEMISHVAVEEKLQQAAGVSEQVFAVSAVPDEKRGERLVVLYAGWDGDIEELLSKVKAAGLPGIWTPSKSAFHKIDSLPLLGTGKLDLKALKDLALKLESASKG